MTTDGLDLRDDRYEVFETLGSNDYLSVQRAWDRRLKRYVAVMELHPRFRANPQHLARVWTDVLASASIEHYGLVRLYEVHKERGWIVTELMLGRLADRIAKTPLTSSEARSVLRVALDALGYLHTRQKLHGDIRPANFLIDDEGHLRLSHPIGLALGGQVPARTVNQKYLAPELVTPEASEPGPATDLYCLGFSVYEMLVGPEFDERFVQSANRGADSATALNWLRWHSSADCHLPPLREIIPKVDADVAELVDRLVLKQMDARPQTAVEAQSLLADDGSDELPTFAEAGASSPPPNDSRGAVLKSRVPNHSLGDESVPHKRPTITTKSQTANGWTLENPWVFRGVAAGVLLAAALVGMKLRGAVAPSQAQGPAPETTGSVTPPEVTPGEPFSAPDTPATKTGIPTPNLAVELAAIRAELKTIQESIAQLEAPDAPTPAPVPASGELTAAIAALARATQALETAVSAVTLSKDEPATIASGNEALPPTVEGAPPAVADEAPPVTPVAATAPELAQQAGKLLESGDFDGALSAILKAIELDATRNPAYSQVAYQAYFGRAKKRNAAGEYPLAADDFFAASDYAGTDADRAIALAGRGETFRLQGEPRRAMADYDRALTLDTRQVVALTGRGMCKLALNDPDGAATDFQATLNLDHTLDNAVVTRLAETFVERSKLSAAAGDREGAIIDAELARHWAPQQPDLWTDVAMDAYLKHGNALQRQKDYSGALVSFDKAVALQGSPTRRYHALNNRGCCKLALRHYTGAIDDLSSAIALDDRAATAYHNRYKVYYSAGNKQQAELDLASARAIDPSISP